MMAASNANGMFSLALHTIAESEGRWPRICNLACCPQQQGEVGYVL